MTNCRTKGEEKLCRMYCVVWNYWCNTSNLLVGLMITDLESNCNDGMKLALILFKSQLDSVLDSVSIVNAAF